MSELAQLTPLELDELALQQGEAFADLRNGGRYACKSCQTPLYSSDDKFIARVRWPSFRRSLPGTVKEEDDYSFGLKRRRLVCAKCGLHLGHLFNDGKAAGDVHADAKDRHCLLSVCLTFISDPSMKEVPASANVTEPAAPAEPKAVPKKVESILGSEVSADPKRSTKESKPAKNKTYAPAPWSWSDYLILGGVTVAITVGVAFALKFVLGGKDSGSGADEALRRAPSSASTIAASDASAAKGL